MVTPPVPVFEKFDEYINKYIEYMENLTENKAKEIWVCNNYNGKNDLWKKLEACRSDPFDFYPMMDNHNREVLFQTMGLNYHDTIKMKISVHIYTWYMFQFNILDTDKLWPDMIHGYKNHIWELYNSNNKNITIFYKLLSMSDKKILYNDIFLHEGSLLE